MQAVNEIARHFGAEAERPMLEVLAARRMAERALDENRQAMRWLLAMSNDGSATVQLYEKMVNRTAQAFRDACDESARLLAALWPSLNTHGDAQIAWLRRHGLAC
jgi:hypothetical protein